MKIIKWDEIGPLLRSHVLFNTMKIAKVFDMNDENMRDKLRGKIKRELNEEERIRLIRFLDEQLNYLHNIREKLR